MKFIPEIIESLVDDIPFFYSYRREAQLSASYSLSDLLEVDNRLNAQLDGMALYGADAWAYLEENLDFQNTGDLFTAAYLALVMNDREKLTFLLELVGNDLELLNSIIDAFIWIDYIRVTKLLEEFFESGQPKLRYIALKVWVGHDQVPDKFSDYLQQSLGSDDNLLTETALYCIGQLGLISFLEQLKIAMDHDNTAVQFAALWSASRFGDTLALEKIEKFVFHPLYGEKALQFIVMQKTADETISILGELYKNEESRRLSIDGLAYLGSFKGISILIEMMTDLSLARRAGYAFSFITGINISENNMDMAPPMGFISSPSEDDDDLDIVADPDEDLPWPDVSKIKTWWSSASQTIDYDQNYITGAISTPKQLTNVLHNGHQLQRQYAATRLAFHQHEYRVFNTQAPVKRQLKRLAIIQPK